MCCSIIGKVLATNNAGNANTYSFKDIQSVNGTVFYKLKQVDRDEKFTYSPVQKITVAGIENNLTVWPNPARNYIDLSFMSNAGGNIPLQVVDVAGKVFLEQSIKTITGLNKTRLSIAAVPAGYYIIKCHVNGMVMTQKIVIAH